MQVTEIHNWSAKRSGAAITVTGYTDGGREILVSGIVEIQSDAPFPLATTADGSRYRLVTVK